MKMMEECVVKLKWTLNCTQGVPDPTRPFDKDGKWKRPDVYVGGIEVYILKHSSILLSTKLCISHIHTLHPVACNTPSFVFKIHHEVFV